VSESSVVVMNPSPKGLLFAIVKKFKCLITELIFRLEYDAQYVLNASRALQSFSFTKFSRRFLKAHRDGLWRRRHY
jgi:hypothetical protein